MYYQQHNHHNHNKPVSIIRKSDRSFVIRLINHENMEPFDISGASQVKAYFPKEEGGAVEKNMTPSGAIQILNPAIGKIEITLDENDTALLNVGEAQSFEVEIQIGSITTVVQFVELLDVLDRIFG